MDTDKLNKLALGYTWDNGIVTSPGKFEGESISTLYYYDAYLNGNGAVMEVSKEEREALGLHESDQWVYVAESNDGFVSLEFYMTQEQAEARDAEESEEEEEEQAEEDADPVYCPMCDSGDSSVLGTLGKRVYYRCTACGMDYSHIVN